MMSPILSSLSRSSSGPKPKVSSRISLTSRWRSLRLSSGFSVSQSCSTTPADLVAQQLRDRSRRSDSCRVDRPACAWMWRLRSSNFSWAGSGSLGRLGRPRLGAGRAWRRRGRRRSSRRPRGGVRRDRRRVGRRRSRRLVPISASPRTGIVPVLSTSLMSRRESWCMGRRLSVEQRLRPDPAPEGRRIPASRPGVWPTVPGAWCESEKCRE